MDTRQIRKVLPKILGDLDYQPVDTLPLAFKANWGQDGIEHFLFASLYGPNQFFTVDFGMLYPPAKEFVRSCLVEFNPQFYGRLPVQTLPCSVTYALGRIAGWGIRESINISLISKEEFTFAITAAIRGKLFPVIKEINSRPAFLRFLMQSPDPITDGRGSIAGRLGTIAFLQRELGKPLAEIESWMLDFVERGRIDFSGQNVDGFLFAKLVARRLASLQH